LHTYLPIHSASTWFTNMMGKMTDDEKGNLWICSPQGLWYFNTESGQFRRFTTADGLAANFCSRVCLDDHEKLWITTIVGISRFDPVTKQFLNFSSREGLPVDYYDGVLTKLKNGNILAGYLGGVVIINPDNFPF